MKFKIGKSITSSLLGILLLGGGLAEANAQINAAWTGGGGDSFWSDANNWSPALVPTNYNTIILTNGIGSTNLQGAVNNEVSGNITIGHLSYVAQVIVTNSLNSVNTATNYHTTLIDPGVTLNIQPTNGTGQAISVGGTTELDYTNDPVYYYIITGAGGSIVAGNTSVPNPSFGVQATAVSTSGLNHKAVLDLSGLDNFTFGGGYFWVGINGGSGNTTARPAGQVYLARTNLIVVNGSVYDISGGADLLGSFRVGESKGGTPYAPSFVQLGQQNTIYTSFLKIAGAAAGAFPSSGGLSGAYMNFETGLVNPTLKLRNTNGVDRVPYMSIADQRSVSSANSIASQGLVDLSGGTVDALVTTMYVGLGCTAGGNYPNCWSSAALTWTAGTFDISSLYIANQNANSGCSITGMVNVASANATLIANNLTMGSRFGVLNSAAVVAVLNIDGGTVIVTNSLSQAAAASTPNPDSTVILTNGGVLELINPMVANFNTLQYGGTIIHNTNTSLTATTINVYSPATTFMVDPGLTLSPSGGGIPGTLNIGGTLTMSGGGLNMDFGSSSDIINVSGDLDLLNTNSISVNVTSIMPPGTYPLITFAGAFNGGLTNLSLTGTGLYGLLSQSRYAMSLAIGPSSINLVISGTPVPLTWSGGNNGNTWDLINTPNWNSGSQEFYQLDEVTFDDSGIGSPPVQLSGSLNPSSVTFNANATNYTLTGSGQITGTGGVTLNGGATVTLLTTNNYTGGTTINAGILQIGDGATGNGALAGAVTNNAELEFSPMSASTNIVTAVIAGSGTMVQNGPGVTKVSGANKNFTGSVTVQQGTLQAGSTNAFGPTTYPTVETIDSGATFDLAGNTTANSFVVQGTGVGGAGAILDSGAGCFMRDVQLNGDASFGGISGWTIESGSATSFDAGLNAAGYNLTKVGTNQVAVYPLNPNFQWSPNWASLNIQQGTFTLIGYLSMTSTGYPINVYSNATLALRTYPTNDLVSSYVLNNGSCVDVPTTVNPTIDGSVTINGTAIFDMAVSQSLTVNCPITGGTLIKGIGYHPALGTSAGSGTLVLAGGANTLSGFQVQTGTVLLTNSSTISAPQLVLAGGTLSVAGRADNTLTLAGGQSLVGNGTVTGIVSSPSGTSIIPSLTNGVITVSSNLTLAGSTSLDLNQTGSVVTNSQIVVGNTLTCGGALVLTSSGAPLQAGATFKLFKAKTITSPFTDASITYPTLGSGLFWTNQIAVNGTVAVVSTVPPMLNVAAAGGGSVLNVTWPTNYVSYTLQFQTNTLNMGLSTNWTTVNTTNNQISLPIVQTNGAVFLRLINQL